MASIYLLDIRQPFDIYNFSQLTTLFSVFNQMSNTVTGDTDTWGEHSNFTQTGPRRELNLEPSHCGHTTFFSPTVFPHGKSNVYEGSRFPHQDFSEDKVQVMFESSMRALLNECKGWKRVLNKDHGLLDSDFYLYLCSKKIIQKLAADVNVCQSTLNMKRSNQQILMPLLLLYHFCPLSTNHKSIECWQTLSCTVRNRSKRVFFCFFFFFNTCQQKISMLVYSIILALYFALVLHVRSYIIWTKAKFV